VTWLVTLWKAEPVFVGDGVKLFLLMLMTFGLPLSQEQLTSVMAFVIFVGAAAQRASVTSPKTLERYWLEAEQAWRSRAAAPEA
jgi:hypothetical protein